MTKWIETTGRSEEDAISAALMQLGMDRDDVSIQVLERAKRGVFGFGSNPAKVRVSYEVEEEEPASQPAQPVPETPREEPARETYREPEAPAPQPEKEPQPEAEEQPEDPVSPPEAQPEPPQGEDRTERISEFLTGLMEHLHVDAKPEIHRSPEGNYKVVLQGKNLGAIIGRRGETLDAIQQLTSYAVNRGQSKRVRVHVDAENYRARREESLKQLALKVAGKVRRNKRNVTLEPMNAYERHVIHTALQDTPGVSTYSVGVEPNRRTVVAYSPGK